MLSSISIENFKGIGDKVDIDLAPITLLFGANSAGKSSIMHALHYAREVLVNQNVDADCTETGGSYVDLGGFRSFVHHRDLEREVTLRLSAKHLNPAYNGETKGPLDIGTEKPMLPPQHLDYIENDQAPLLRHAINEIACEFSIAWSELTGSAHVVRYTIWCNDHCLGTIRYDPDSDECYLTDFLENPFIPACIYEWMDPGEFGGEYRNELLEKGVDASKTFINSQHFFLFEPTEGDYVDWLPTAKNRIKNEMKNGRLPLSRFSAGAMPEPGSKRSEMIQYLTFCVTFDSYVSDEEILAYNTYAYYLNYFFIGIRDAFQQELDAFRYLGPLRKAYTQNDSPPKHSDPARWASGLGAWDELQTTAVENDDYIQEVSDWLSAPDRLDTGYSLKLQRFKEVDIFSELYEKLINGDHSDEVRESLENLKVSQRLFILSPDDLEMRPYDVGAGISQVIPVVAAALSRDAHCVGIEQPELHLHPRIAARLGDLFIHGIRRSSSREFIIETHSEHLMLRLLRRIRETTEESLPKGHPGLKPDEVVVAYVYQKDGRTVVKRLRIDESGDFVNRWPDGFFDERLDELL